jgi:hypothetical protein
LALPAVPGRLTLYYWDSSALDQLEAGAFRVLPSPSVEPSHVHVRRSLRTGVQVARGCRLRVRRVVWLVPRCSKADCRLETELAALRGRAYIRDRFGVAPVLGTRVPGVCNGGAVGQVGRLEVRRRRRWRRHWSRAVGVAGAAMRFGLALWRTARKAVGTGATAGNRRHKRHRGTLGIECSE